MPFILRRARDERERIERATKPGSLFTPEYIILNIDLTFHYSQSLIFDLFQILQEQLKAMMMTHIRSKYRK